MAKRISLHEFQAGLARRLAEARDTRASAFLRSVNSVGSVTTQNRSILTPTSAAP